MKNDGDLKKRLEAFRLKGYSLHVGEGKQLRLSGWRGIKLYLGDAAGNLSDRPVIEGIFSWGNRGKIQPWMDLIYTEAVSLTGKGDGEGATLRLDDAAIDGELFRHLGGLIPRGGHLMVSYEGTDPVHRDTLRGLYAQVPPAATPLGFLLFNAGFEYIKDWYLAEGGNEGPRKLWAEKAPDDGWKMHFLKKTEDALVLFLKRGLETEHRDLNSAGRERAEKILRAMRGPKGS
ncbi:MAG: DUF1122 domain-containing protein [Deltaproteobacteria bacterium]|nr:DUF1122 domain-containing protein [Deltaproteobacteria bacterium]NIS77180.1 DUF1122 domain-containing protein [Deltaproteobacteria bacterium]